MAYELRPTYGGGYEEGEGYEQGSYYELKSYKHEPSYGGHYEEEGYGYESKPTVFNTDTYASHYDEHDYGYEAPKPTVSKHKQHSMDSCEQEPSYGSQYGDE